MEESEPDHEAAGAASIFEEHRGLLFGVTYGMLGTLTDTEDVLQEAWLAWSGADHADVRHPRAYLVRLTVNKALAHRDVVQRRKESYVGQWLPEPLLADPADASEAVLRAESLSMALLVVLESLSPTERAVFVLHDVFGHPHQEIAELLGRSHAAVRQTARRARAHVQARRPRYPVDPRTRERVTDRFIEAAMGGDLDALLELLSPDVVLRTDGGGKGPATSSEPVRGAAAVAELLHAVAAGTSARFTVERHSTNDQTACVLWSEESPVAVLVLDLDPHGRVREVYSVTNQDKVSASTVAPPAG